MSMPLAGDGGQRRKSIKRNLYLFRRHSEHIFRANGFLEVYKLKIATGTQRGLARFSVRFLEYTSFFLPDHVITFLLNFLTTR